MDEDVGDPFDVVAEGAADGAGDLVGRLDCQGGVDFEVEVDVVLEAGFAGVALLDAQCAGDAGGAGADLVEHRRGGHGVEQLPRALP